jgi:hypothetical protein
VNTYNNEFMLLVLAELNIIDKTIFDKFPCGTFFEYPSFSNAQSEMLL